MKFFVRILFKSLKNKPEIWETTIEIVQVKLKLEYTENDLKMVCNSTVVLKGTEESRSCN